VLESEGSTQARDGRQVQGMRGGYGRGERKGGGVRRDSQNGLQGSTLLCPIGTDRNRLVPSSSDWFRPDSKRFRPDSDWNQLDSDRNCL